MSRIVRLHAFGGPEVLQLDEVEVREPGPGQVRIRIGAIGLNRIEAIYRAGGFGPVGFPARIGYEAAGVIDAVGVDVETFSVGDRVAVLPGLPMPTHGVCGETAICPADMLVATPDWQTHEEAAATWMAFLTAFSLLEGPGVQPGDPVVITAAASSVGLAAIQIVKACGGISIATTRGHAKVEALTAHGADHVIATDKADVADAVRALTGGAGAAIAFDAVCGDALERLVGAMAPRGRIIVYGALGGERTGICVNPFMLNGLTVRGFATHLLVGDQVSRTRAVDYVRTGLSEGVLQPVIDRTFGLHDVVAAHRYLESNAQVGKIVLRVD